MENPGETIGQVVIVIGSMRNPSNESENSKQQPYLGRQIARTRYVPRSAVALALKVRPK